jgi:dTDP-4-amino-4,6-dideoxygalactose transaminase
MIVTIPFQQPEMPSIEHVSRYFDKSVGERFFSNGGPCAQLLEERVAEYLGVKHVVLCNNATTALLISVRAVFGGGRAPRGTRRVVVVPSFTFAATIASLLWAGYEPHFVDIDPVNLHADPSSVRAAFDALGDRLAGALLCSTFGVAPALTVQEAWKRACDDASVPLVVDSAAGFGSIDECGVPLGHQGAAEIFSFHATKPFAIGEGGAVVTDDDEVIERLRPLINFGFDANRVVSGEPGINGKLPEILCAFGLAVLDNFDTVVSRRRRLARRMADRMVEVARSQPGLAESAVQFVPVLVDPARRSAVCDSLAKRGIQVRTYFDPPLHRMPAFAGVARQQLDGTELASASVLSLPMWNDLTEASADAICDAVLSALP